MLVRSPLALALAGVALACQGPPNAAAAPDGGIAASRSVVRGRRVSHLRDLRRGRRPLLGRQRPRPARARGRGRPARRVQRRPREAAAGDGRVRRPVQHLRDPGGRRGQVLGRQQLRPARPRRHRHPRRRRRARWATALPAVDLGTGRRAVALALGNTASVRAARRRRHQVLGRPLPGRDGPRRHPDPRRPPRDDGRQPADRRPRQPRRRAVRGQGDRGVRLPFVLRDPGRHGRRQQRAQVLGQQRLLRARPRHARQPRRRSGHDRQRPRVGRSRHHRRGRETKGDRAGRRLSVDLRARRRRRGRLLGHKWVRPARHRRRPGARARARPTRWATRTSCRWPRPRSPSPRAGRRRATGRTRARCSRPAP